MDYTTIILVLAMILALIVLIKNRTVKNSVIVVFQLIYIVLTLIGGSIILQIAGICSFGVSLLLAFLYPFLIKEKNLIRIVVIYLLVIPVLLVFAYSINDYPDFSLIRWSMLLPLIAFIYAIINRVSYKNEISFMILFATFALLKFIGLFLVY